VFRATKKKYKDVEFRQFNVDDGSTASLRQQYGVRGIPHIVFLDGGGNVLYSRSGAPANEDSFTSMIERYR